jgi:hypothetical protein
LDFSAYFAAFFATFAAFFTTLELLVFFAIWCGPPIVVATSWTALCMSQGPADSQTERRYRFLLESFAPRVQNFTCIKTECLALSTNRRTLHGLGYGMDNSEIILVALPKGLCIRGRDLLRIVAKRGKLAAT